MTGIPVFVINLDRSPARLSHAREQLEADALTFTRIPAVDARDLSEATIAAVYDEKRSRRSYYAPLHKGEIACFLSHRLAWETFLSTSDAPIAVILEDDFTLQGSLRRVIEAVLAADIPGWDMIKLWSRKNSGVSAVALDDRYRLVRHRVLPSGTVGQMISRVGAEKLRTRALPVTRPLDVQIQYWWDLDLDVLSLDPPLVGEESALIGGSDIKQSMSGGLMRKLRREVGRPAFRLSLFAKSAYHDWRRSKPKTSEKVTVPRGLESV